MKHFNRVDLQNGLLTSNVALTYHLRSLFSSFDTYLCVTILYGWKITTIVDDLKIAKPVMSNLTRIYVAWALKISRTKTDKNRQNLFQDLISISIITWSGYVSVFYFDFMDEIIATAREITALGTVVYPESLRRTSSLALIDLRLS